MLLQRHPRPAVRLRPLRASLPGEGPFVTELALTRRVRVPGKTEDVHFISGVFIPPLEDFCGDIKPPGKALGNHHLFKAGKKFQKC